jgi:hypothetical protein
VFPVRNDRHLHMKSKVMPVTGRGGLQAYDMSRILDCLYSWQ